MHDDWPVKKSHCQFANQVGRTIGKHIFSTLLNPLGAQNKDVCAASQTLLTGVHYPWCLMGETLHTSN